MTLKITYIYETWAEGCGCCSNSANLLEFYNTDGEYWEEDFPHYCENEQELREYLKETHPGLLAYEIDQDSRWF